MRNFGPSRPRAAGGFTLIELLVSVAIIGMLAALAVPMYTQAIRQGRATALQADGKALHSAMMRYYKDHGSFPSEADLNTATLAPLTTSGYLSTGEAITSKLTGGQLFVYLAPDVGGADRQFVTVLQHAADPRVIVGVVHTNLVTDDGEWVDGSYIIDEDDVKDAGLN